jgi:DNA-binding transcriptional LysR family regulator
MARRFDFVSLQLFVSVCEAKSIARASEIENIAASAISKRITHMEHLAGTALIARNRSGVSATKAGLILLEHARNVLHNLDLIERDLASDARNPRGFMRIFASASAIAEFLPAAIVSFLEIPKHREIDIQLEELVTHDIVAGVRGGQATLGICWADADMTGLEWVPYRSDHLALIVNSKHSLAGATGIGFAETLQFEHVGLRPGSAVTTMLRRESVRAGTLLRYRVMVSTFEAAIGVVRSGLAVAVVPAEIASPLAAVTGICVIPLTDAWAERQFAICYRSRRALSRTAVQFLAHLLKEAGSA